MVDKSNWPLWLGCLGTLSASILWYLSHNGLFKKLKVAKKKFGSYVIVYTELVGPYKNVGKEFQRLSDLLKEADIEVILSCGFYFDDPADTPAENCRACIGMIVQENLDDRGMLLAKQELLGHPAVKKEGLKVGLFPETDCMCIDFPMNGVMSIIIGIKRCYPELFKHVDVSKSGGCTLEIYDMKARKQVYTVPLTTSEDFLPFEIKKKA